MKNYYISSKSTKRFTQAKRRDIPKFHVTQKDNNMDLNKYGFAIIGTGAIAAIHAKAIAEIPTATLVAVYNRTKAKPYYLHLYSVWNAFGGSGEIATGGKTLSH